MKTLLVGLVAAVALTGCSNGRSGPGQLTRSKLHLSETAKSKDLDIDSHKDVTIDKLRRVSPDGTIFEVEGYKSRANEAAIVNATKQAESAAKVADSNVEMLKTFGGLAAQYFSGGAVRPQPASVPATVVLTNAPAK